MHVVCTRSVTCEHSGDVQFYLKARRTCSVVDLDRTAKTYGITAENVHRLIRRVPGVQLSVYHILDTDLPPAHALAIGMHAVPATALHAGQRTGATGLYHTDVQTVSVEGA